MEKSFTTQILVVDDDPSVVSSMKALFGSDYQIISANTGRAGLDLLNKSDVQLVLLDLGLPDISGMEVLRQVKEINPLIEVVLITGNTTLEAGIEAMKTGAYDYVVKPFDVDRLTVTVRNALQKTILLNEIRYHRAIGSSQRKTLIGQSRAMKEIYSTIEKLADNDATVLITGGSGTGKDLVAQAIHNTSYRKDGPFVPVNCGAIPAELVESELFGHEKGAFTGASNKKIGKFELAQYGTLFLDEISALPLALQAKLLRVLQEKTIERVGGTRPIAVNIRIIAATNENIQEMIKQNQFREDLFYRLNIVPVQIPPLKDRREDIPVLVNHFLDFYNKEYHRRITRVNPEVMQVLLEYTWPGNVRELENLIQRMLVIASGKEITAEDLPLEILKQNDQITYVHSDLSLDLALADFERQCIKRALAKAKDNRQDAAKLLQIHRNTLLNRMKALGMDDKADTSGPSDMIILI